MPTFVLDTDILSDYQGGHLLVTARVEHHRDTTRDRVGLAITTVDEQVDGWRASLNTAKDNTARAAAYRFYVSAVDSWRDFEVFPMSAAALDTFDRLVRMKLNVGRNDLRIAAVALDLGATVVTRNRRDFARVPGLPIEDWSV